MGTNKVWKYFWILTGVLQIWQTLHGRHAYDQESSWRDPLSQKEFLSLEPPKFLENRVEFWVKVFTRLSEKEAYLHDTFFPEVVYEKIRVEDVSERELREKVRERKIYWQRVLRSIYFRLCIGEELRPEENYVYEQFKKVRGFQPLKVLQASQLHRFRLQRGLKERFKIALEQSGKYLSRMESIFTQKGIPAELTRLPFVESSFNVSATSKVGAAGIWQFMHQTGKDYLKITALIDERRDPFQATRAAARLLEKNYEKLQSWPLAIMAYNHGVLGILRATEKMGTKDLEKLIFEYQSPNFGFASRNFYAEFLAAVRVEKKAEEYFGSLQKHPEWEYIEVGVADYIPVHVLLRYLDLDTNWFRELNPSLSDLVFQGKYWIPAGHILRIPSRWGNHPEGPRESFWTAYLKIPERLKFRKQRT